MNEKNSKLSFDAWVDRSTNINPFEKTSTFVHPAMVIVRIFVACLKIPLFIFIFSLSFLYYVLAMIIPVNEIRTVLIKINSKIFDRILLFLLGNVFISVEPTSIVDTFNELGEVDSVNPGDIIISNFGSYLNLIWFQMQYSPFFVVPYDSKSVIVYSFFTILVNSLSNHPMKKGKRASLEKILKIAKENRSPVVVFPECTPTNGSGILQFTEFGENIDFSKTKFHIFCFSHRNSGPSPNFTFGNGLLHLFKMLGRTMSGMKVKIALPQDVPHFKCCITSDWLQNVRMVMSKILRVPLLSVDYEAARQYYDSINSESKIHKD